jgi:hypothetical protein
MTTEPGPYEGPEWEAAKRRAEELAAMFTAHQAVTEAELAAQGIHPVSVAHGSPETNEDADLIFEVLPRLARECGTVAGTRGGGEHTTYLFAGPGADTAVVAFMARALAIAPRWCASPPQRTRFGVCDQSRPCGDDSKKPCITYRLFTPSERAMLTSP